MLSRWRRLVTLRLLPNLTAAPCGNRRNKSSSTHASDKDASYKESAEDTTHFGFQSVTRDQKAHKVHEVFSSVAAKYDLMNDVMSAGIHRCWKDHFIRRLDPVPGCEYLDVAGGTGDIGFRILNHINTQYAVRHLDRNENKGDDEGSKMRKQKATNGTHVTICDINQNMLTEGEKRFSHQVHDPDRNAVTFIIGDAMNLPFDDNTFDAYTIAFGIRNVVDINIALKEAIRVLKPGGMFSCLEFSRVQNPVLEQVYDWYSFNLIPVYGEILAGDWKSYQYLVESICKFPDQEDFKDMIQDVGFRLVHYENLANGIACIHSGYKDDSL